MSQPSRSQVTRVTETGVSTPRRWLVSGRFKLMTISLSHLCDLSDRVLLSDSSFGTPLRGWTILSPIVGAVDRVRG